MRFYHAPFQICTNGSRPENCRAQLTLKLFIQRLLRFLLPHWSIIDHMTCAKSSVERHHSPAVQFRLFLSHHCTLTSLTMYKVYGEVSGVAVQWYQWIKRNCTPRHIKHKGWYAHGLLPA